MSGDVHVRFCERPGVRFPRATHLVMGFQRKEDAARMKADLQDRLGKFSLRMNEAKTRVIEFGRIPAHRRARDGERRPRTFSFLGFTHYCAWTRSGTFIVKRKTEHKRLARKLRELRIEARRRQHAPLAKQQRWLGQVLRGHYAYYGLPSNHRALSAFCHQVKRLWYRSLRRRSQRSLTWKRFARIIELFPLPEPRITHRREAFFAGSG